MSNSSESTSFPYVIIIIDNNQFAVPAVRVREIVRMPAWVSVPQTPTHVRGVVNIRGNIIRLLDSRLFLGSTSAADELAAMLELMTARERDHVKWLHELEASIRDRKPFTLSLDPRQCAFGKWYYQYQPSNAGVAWILRKFESPHNAIHAVGRECITHAEKGEFDLSFAIIERTRKLVLSQLLDLFEESRQAFRDGQRELALVLELNDELLALAIDGVDSVESIDESMIENAALGSVSSQTDCLRRTAKRGKSGEILFLLDTAQLFHAAGTQVL